MENNTPHKKRFKDKSLQKMYCFLMEHPPIKEADYHSGSTMIGGSIRSWFKKGYNGVPFRHVVKGSHVHAAWAAGQDTKKQHTTQNGGQNENMDRTKR